jgi:pyruvate/2-oxoglutarate dehydrogenase complex dihydrolipoamide acyltransferase (E2) component
MPHEVTMPQLGMAQDAGKIVSWLKGPGDAVTKGDPLFEVETDKATMEVEAQASGYLTHVSAAQGEDVPVGQVIARISESADVADPVPASVAPESRPEGDAAALPEGREITMPQLGMAQDSGILVTWRVELGAQIGPDDLLFEVETDKATMDVPAGVSGWLAATLAQAGEDVPVGQAVAVISAEKPENPVARAAALAPSKPERKPEPERKPAPEPEAKPSPAPAVAAAPPVAGSGRILASPKLRRAAQLEGLDLARLVAAGQPQPYHMRDLAQLQQLSSAATAPVPAATALRLQADCAQDGFAEFADWATDTMGLTDPDALLAGMAGASLGRGATIAVARFGQRRLYAVPQTRRLSEVAKTDAAPDLLLRDLRATPVRHVAIGAEDVPVLTVTAQGAGLSVTLECSAAQMGAEDALALVSEFAGRLSDPRRHLL